MDGNIPGENFLGENFPGENFPEESLIDAIFPTVRSTGITKEKIFPHLCYINANFKLPVFIFMYFYVLFHLWL